MPLSVPQYIQAAGINSSILHYEWDEWNVKKYYTTVDEELLERLSILSYRAKVAMTIASAEWVVARFDALSNDKTPRQYLEAAWAGNIDLRYARYIETNDDEWRGPVRGPLNMTISIVVDALFCKDESAEPAENPAWMCALAEHVIPAKEPFWHWRDRCLDRLQALYTAREDKDDLFDEDQALGGIVPREVFDPEKDSEPDRSAQLANLYLQGLEVHANPFLRSPQELLEEGFEGVPYTYPADRMTNES